jgi:hypothetical protein
MFHRGGLPGLPEESGRGTPLYSRSSPSYEGFQKLVVMERRIPRAPRHHHEVSIGRIHINRLPRPAKTLIDFGMKV